jgi:hypothetical protein
MALFHSQTNLVRFILNYGDQKGLEEIEEDFDLIDPFKSSCFWGKTNRTKRGMQHAKQQSRSRGRLAWGAFRTLVGYCVRARAASPCLDWYGRMQTGTHHHCSCGTSSAGRARAATSRQHTSAHGCTHA